MVTHCAGLARERAPSIAFSVAASYVAGFPMRRLACAVGSAPGPRWAAACPHWRAAGRRCALCAGLAVRLLDPLVRLRKRFRSGGHG